MRYQLILSLLGLFVMAASASRASRRGEAIDFVSAILVSTIFAVMVILAP